MGHVEELRRAHQLGRLLLVTAQLRDTGLDGVGVGWVLVLDDGDRYAVDHEHHVGTVGLAGGRLEPPFPSHVQNIR